MLFRRHRDLSSIWIGLAVLAFASISLQAGAQGAPASTRTSEIVQAQPADATTAALPDSPGATLLALNSRTESSATQSSQTQSGQTQQQQTTASPQKPVGTAAAEAPNTSGIAASQPAGVAIAPAKQHRVRTLILRTGAIIGAGVAIGTVVALTAATPSKPPGAH
jgi:hypothetical protein